MIRLLMIMPLHIQQGVNFDNTRARLPCLGAGVSGTTNQDPDFHIRTSYEGHQQQEIDVWSAVLLIATIE